MAHRRRQYRGEPAPAAESLDTAIQKALVDAINDEYKALMTYQAVMKKFGAVHLLVNIAQAEERHIAALEILFERYGLEVPMNTWYGQVPEFTTLKDACEAGVQAEIANAARCTTTFSGP